MTTTTSSSNRALATIEGDPLAVDFLCGRTAHCLNHPGSRFVKEQCTRRVGTYRHAEKPVKEAINAQIVVLVYARGGRFLVNDGREGGWARVNYVKARQKVSSVFRNLIKRRQQQPTATDTVMLEDEVLQGRGVEELRLDQEHPIPPLDAPSLPLSVITTPMSIESCFHGTSIAGSSERCAMEIDGGGSGVAERIAATGIKEKDGHFSDLSSEESMQSVESNETDPASPEKVQAIPPTTMHLLRRIATGGRNAILECFQEISERLPLSGGSHGPAATSTCMDTISKAMTDHLQDSQIQGFGCLAMVGVTKDLAHSLEVPTTHRSAEAVMTAMRTHLSDEKVQGHGMSALANFSQHVEVPLSGMEAVVAAMQRHSSASSLGRSCQFVQRNGCYALSRLAARASSQRRLFEAGGFVVVIDAMREHLNDENIQLHGCKILVALAGPAPGIVLNPRLALTAAKAAMGEYPDNEQIQTIGNEIRQAVGLCSNPRLSSCLAIATTTTERPILGGEFPRPDGKEMAKDEVTQATEETATLTTLSAPESDSESKLVSHSWPSGTNGTSGYQAVHKRWISDAHGDEGMYTGDVSQSKGIPHGFGSMIYRERGRSYEGDWYQGRWHGSGTAMFPNGDSYRGQYRNGGRHGQGKYCWGDGRVYEGSFVDDKRHGRGIYKWPDGAIYNGEYVMGRREGHGHYSYANNRGHYTGSWVRDEFEGHGAFQQEDGRFYFGQWKGGSKHGPGVEIFEGKEVHNGEWRHGQPVQ